MARIVELLITYMPVTLVKIVDTGRGFRVAKERSGREDIVEMVLEGLERLVGRRLTETRAVLSECEEKPLVAKIGSHVFKSKVLSRCEYALRLALARDLGLDAILDYTSATDTFA